MELIPLIKAEIFTHKKTKQNFAVHKKNVRMLSFQAKNMLYLTIEFHHLCWHKMRVRVYNITVRAKQTFFEIKELRNECYAF